MRNHNIESNDLTHMECHDAREAISAELDGSRATPAAQHHVDTCAECRAWRDGAVGLRRATLQPAASMSPVDIEGLRPVGFRRNRWLRSALAWAGALLLAWNLPGVVTGGSDVASTHLFRHQAAFSAALGLTFVIVAWRPDRAYGLVPFAAAFTAALTTAAAIDLLGGASDVGVEARHLVEIAGLGVLWVLGAGAGPSRRKLRRRGEPSVRRT